MSFDSQIFETYVPVYDAIPDKWEEAQEFLVERLKELANAVNIREVGWLLDEEILNGQSFFPPSGISGTSEQFRTVLRKVIDFSPLVIGVNTRAHGITFDANFSLLHQYAAATTSGLTARPIPNDVESITMDATNIYITATAAALRCYCTTEYIQEL